MFSENKTIEILEFFKGITLDKLVRDFPLRLKEKNCKLAKNIMTQIIKGLELNYIFEPQTKNKQIVAHNDLKTENVMIQFHEGGDDVTVKLIDYGLSTVISCQ